MNTSGKAKAGKIVLIVSIIYTVVSCIAFAASDKGLFTHLDVIRMISRAIPGIVGIIVGIILFIVGKKSQSRSDS